MSGGTGRRSLVVAAIACAALGASTAIAMRAGASGGSGAPRQAAAQSTAQITATNAYCGQTITASLTLNGDLNCSGGGTALTVSGKSIVLNLGGHRVNGPGTAQSVSGGVRITGTSNTVENGLITNFVDGVDVSGVTETVSAVRAGQNSRGIYDMAQGTKITNSAAISNASIGIVGSGQDAVYSGDHEVSNGSDGLYLSTDKATVTGNIANDNGRYGIWARFGAVTLAKNIADFNASDGIYVSDITSIDGGTNSAKGNDTTTGQIPEQCHGIVCS